MKLFSIFTQNPILVHSLRSRRLNWRMVTAIVLALLSYSPACLIVASFVLAGVVGEFDFGDFVDDLDEVGGVIFYVTAIFLLILVTFFAPTMSASAIAGEKQRQTLDLLLVTLLPTRSIVMGKLISALVYTLLLIAAAWPMILLCLATGGVKIIELIVTFILLMITSVAFTMIGLFISSLSRSTTNAAMLTYGVALPAVLIGPFLGMLPVTIILSLADVSYRVEEAVNFYGWSLAASLNPIGAAIYSAVLYAEEGGVFWAQQPFSSNGPYILYPWVIYFIFYTFVTWFLVQLTTRRLERMDR